MSLTRFCFCLLLALLAACGAKPEEEVTDAIDTALYHLSRQPAECQEAIDVLEDVGDEDDNSLFLQTLASAYACRGGFSELELFDEVGTIDSQALLGSLAQLSSSPQTQAESSDFEDLQTAIDILLYSGGRDVPSAVVTKSKFGTRHGTNMNMQAIYMILVQLGRYASWYGNTDASGDKGAGGQSNTCFMDYEAGPGAVATGHGGSNACTATNQGSDSLDYVGVTTAVAQRRLCQGAMLINNLLDLLENTTLSSNSSLGDIGQIYAEIEPYVDNAALLHPDMPAFIANLSQTDCEAAVAADDDAAQYYFASIFEGGLP